MTVRLFVCHTPVLCVNGYTYRQSFFTVGSPTILFFCTKRDGNILTGNLLTGMSNAITIFDQYRSLSQN